MASQGLRDLLQHRTKSRADENYAKPFVVYITGFELHMSSVHCACPV